jgi:hypothetical protein
MCTGAFYEKTFGKQQQYFENKAEGMISLIWDFRKWILVRD